MRADDGVAVRYHKLSGWAVVELECDGAGGSINDVEEGAEAGLVGGVSDPHLEIQNGVRLRQPAVFWRDERGLSLLEAAARLHRTSGAHVHALCLAQQGQLVYVQLQLFISDRLWEGQLAWRPSLSAAVMFTHIRPSGEAPPKDVEQLAAACRSGGLVSSAEGEGNRACFSLASVLSELPSFARTAYAEQKQRQQQQEAQQEGQGKAQRQQPQQEMEQQQQQQAADGPAATATVGLCDLPLEAVRGVACRLALKDLLSLGSCCRAMRVASRDVVPGMKLTLHPHQREALQWMLRREGPPVPLQHPCVRSLEVEGGSLPLYLDTCSGQLACEEPPGQLLDIRGGLFCDEPGLGKTITLLSLILKTRGMLPKAPEGAKVTVLPGKYDRGRTEYYTLPQGEDGAAPGGSGGSSGGGGCPLVKRPQPFGLRRTISTRSTGSGTINGSNDGGGGGGGNARSQGVEAAAGSDAFVNAEGPPAASGSASATISVQDPQANGTASAEQQQQQQRQGRKQTARQQQRKKVGSVLGKRALRKPLEQVAMVLPEASSAGGSGSSAAALRASRRVAARQATAAAAAAGDAGTGATAEGHHGPAGNPAGAGQIAASAAGAPAAEEPAVLGGGEGGALAGESGAGGWHERDKKAVGRGGGGHTEEKEEAQQTWVQCDSCHTWRTLPAGHEVEDDVDWTCQMHPLLQDCSSMLSAEEEQVLGPKEAWRADRYDGFYLPTPTSAVGDDGDGDGEGSCAPRNVRFFRRLLAEYPSESFDSFSATQWLAKQRPEELMRKGVITVPQLFDRSLGFVDMWKELGLELMPAPNGRRKKSDDSSGAGDGGNGNVTASSVRRWTMPGHLSHMMLDTPALLQALWLGPLQPLRPVFLSPATLVVVPENLIPHWVHQLDTHTQPGVLRYDVIGPREYGGSSLSSSSLHRLACGNDLVLTTFQFLSHCRHQRGGSPLKRVHWLRIVLDEGHLIGSLATTNRLSTAIQLKAERRWVMTGTPTPAKQGSNNIAHLQPLLEFLHEQVYGLQRKAWDVAVRQPFERGLASGRLRLLDLLRRVMIRAAKADLITIPPCRQRDVGLDFALGHAGGYNDLVDVIKRNLMLADWYDPDHEESLLNRKKTRQWSVEMWRNLRLSCNVAGNIMVAPTEQDVKEALEMLADWRGYQRPLGPGPPFLPDSHPLACIEAAMVDGAPCGCCGQFSKLPLVTPCAHVLCVDCCAKDSQHCPAVVEDGGRVCGAPYIMQPIDDPSRKNHNPNPKWEVPQDLIELQPAVAQRGAHGLSGGQWQATWEVTRSTKCVYLFRRLLEVGAARPVGWRGDASAPLTKVIVYSEFWMHMRVVCRHLDQHGVGYCMLYKGSGRQAASDVHYRFKDFPHISVLVMDGEGAVGHDWSFVRHVFLMEPLEDESVRQQVISRAHRMGARHEVQVETLYMRNSTEEEMVAERSRQLQASSAGARVVREPLRRSGSRQHHVASVGAEAAGPFRRSSSIGGGQGPDGGERAGGGSNARDGSSSGGSGEGSTGMARPAAVAAAASARGAAASGEASGGAGAGGGGGGDALRECMLLRLRRVKVADLQEFHDPDCEEEQQQQQQQWSEGGAGGHDNLAAPIAVPIGGAPSDGKGPQQHAGGPSQMDWLRDLRELDMPVGTEVPPPTCALELELDSSPPPSPLLPPAPRSPLPPAPQPLLPPAPTLRQRQQEGQHGQQQQERQQELQHGKQQQEGEEAEKGYTADPAAGGGGSSRGFAASDSSAPLAGDPTGAALAPPLHSEAQAHAAEAGVGDGDGKQPGVREGGDASKPARKRVRFA